MTLEQNVSPTQSGPATSGQAGTDDSDAQHLEKFGYKQELNRALGLFSSFGVQFTSISVG